MENPFVRYLNRYTTTSPEHEAAFDEFVSQTGPPSGGPLRIETETERFLLSRLEGASPPSIILTGNAGDGKTYLCRQVFKKLTGDESVAWKNDPVQMRCLEKSVIKIVKDLSEISVEAGAQILVEMAHGLATSRMPVVFLVAANEGRLRDVLACATRLDNDSNVAELKRTIDLQLDGESTREGDRLLVVDLNKTCTSRYAGTILDWIAEKGRWDHCAICPARNACPIFHNATKLGDLQVKTRLELLYRILEYLGTHTTVRDMLIHLAHTLTGGLDCTKVIEMHSSEKLESHRYAYYRNVWGEAAPTAFKNKVGAVRNLRELGIGVHSIFEIDTYIVQGDPVTAVADGKHEEMFGNSVDMSGRSFWQDRIAYLRGGSSSPRPRERHRLLNWMHHCRWKLFFEWNDYKRANALLPFLFFGRYLLLLDNNFPDLQRAQRELLVGLNRAFSKLYVSNDESLYVTSHYSNSVEQPVPLVRLKLPKENVRLSVNADGVSPTSYNRAPGVGRLKLLFLPPAEVAEKPVEWSVNLLRFEYLMRLSHGGTFGILSDECELAIRQLKDELLNRFSRETGQPSSVSFFAVQDNRYVLQELFVDGDTIQFAG